MTLVCFTSIKRIRPIRQRFVYPERTMTEIRYKFREAKAVQAAAEFLRLGRGRENYTKLIKLLYLLDRSALVKWGAPVTGDRMVSMPFGPVVSNIYDLISTQPDFDNPQIWHQYIARTGYEVELSKDPGRGELSDAEISIITALHEEHRNRDYREMIKFCHDPLNVPEWHDPAGSSSDIWPEQILKLSGWSDEDIEEDARELRHYEQTYREVGFA